MEELLKRPIDLRLRLRRRMTMLRKQVTIRSRLECPTPIIQLLRRRHPTSQHPHHNPEANNTESSQAQPPPTQPAYGFVSSSACFNVGIGRSSITTTHILDRNHGKAGYPVHDGIIVMSGKAYAPCHPHPHTPTLPHMKMQPMDRRRFLALIRRHRRPSTSPRLRPNPGHPKHRPDGHPHPPPRPPRPPRPRQLPRPLLRDPATLRPRLLLPRQHRPHRPVQGPPPANTGLIAQFKALAPNGVLRLGGNTSDYGFWRPTPTSTAPPRAHRDYKVGDPNPNLSYPVTPEAIHNLRAFLDATGWTCLYGINLGTNIPSLAADEATAVTAILGPKLEYIQLGNEADRFGSTIRDPKTWTADAYFDEWLTFVNAIREKLPYAKFGMPDIASNSAWFATITNRFSLLALPVRNCPCDLRPTQPCSCMVPGPDTNPPSRPNIACLSHHYYIGGPPSNPAMTIEHILAPNPVVPRDAALVTAAAHKLNVPYRMTEGNTCYRGGKPGVSDTFASALWAADYLLQLASLGYAGVNLHGGDAQMVANSLGGTLPGDELVLAAHGDPATHPHPYYTPIAHIGNNYLLEPVAYGMLFAGHFANSTMVPVNFNPGTVNATAYVADLSGVQTMAIINKDLSSDLAVAIPFGYHVAETLTALGLDSRIAKLHQGQTWGSTTVNVPHASAVILRTRGQ